jgi:DNA invertase Pin-like site-specific DNA recombinase
MSERVIRQLGALREKHEAEIRKLVANAASRGVRSEDIARALGIGRSTLWRRYRDALGSYRDPPDGQRPTT